MNEEAPDELGYGQGHGFVAMTLLGAIVLPFEGNTVFIAGLYFPLRQRSGFDHKSLIQQQSATICLILFS